MLAAVAVVLVRRAAILMSQHCQDWQVMAEPDQHRQLQAHQSLMLVAVVVVQGHQSHQPQARVEQGAAVTVLEALAAQQGLPIPVAVVVGLVV